MQDPLIYRELEQMNCPECGALFVDDVALQAHREQEHAAEVEGTARRPENEDEKVGIVREQLAQGHDHADPDEHNRESPRPTEPAP